MESWESGVGESSWFWIAGSQQLERVLGFGQLGFRVKVWVLKGLSGIYWGTGKTSINLRGLLLIVLI